MVILDYGLFLKYMEIAHNIEKQIVCFNNVL